MERSEINATIAMHFGFTRSSKYPIDGKDQWVYPLDWYLPQGGTPCTHIPDFLTILEDYFNLMKLHDFGGPRERFEEE